LQVLVPDPQSLVSYSLGTLPFQEWLRTHSAIATDTPLLLTIGSNFCSMDCTLQIPIKNPALALALASGLAVARPAKQLFQAW